MPINGEKRGKQEQAQHMFLIKHKMKIKPSGSATRSRSFQLSVVTKRSVSCIHSHNKHYTVNPHGNYAGYDNVFKYMTKNRMF